MVLRGQDLHLDAGRTRIGDHRTGHRVQPVSQQAQRHGHLGIALECLGSGLRSVHTADTFGLADDVALTGLQDKIRAGAHDDVHVGVPRRQALLRIGRDNIVALQWATREMLQQERPQCGVDLGCPAESRGHLPR